MSNSAVQDILQVLVLLSGGFGVSAISNVFRRFGMRRSDCVTRFFTLFGTGVLTILVFCVIMLIVNSFNIKPHHVLVYVVSLVIFEKICNWLAVVASRKKLKRAKK